MPYGGRSRVSCGFPSFVNLPPMLATTALFLLSQSAVLAPQELLQISPQGLFSESSTLNHQDAHGWTLEVTPVVSDLTYIESDLRLESADGEVRLLAGVAGTGFLVSRFGQVIAMEATHSEAVPVRVRVLSPEGQVELERKILGLTDPALSSDGDQLVLRTRKHTAVLDLESLELDERTRAHLLRQELEAGRAGRDGDTASPDWLALERGRGVLPPLSAGTLEADRLAQRWSSLDLCLSQLGRESLDEVAWYSTSKPSEEGPHKVCLKKENGFGLCDMSGNIFEWVWDRFGYYKEINQTDPTGEKKGAKHVRRGGSWRSTPEKTRTSNRAQSRYSIRYDFIGFRLVRLKP